MPRIGRALIRGFQNIGHMAVRAFNAVIPHGGPPGGGPPGGGPPGGGPPGGGGGPPGGGPPGGGPPLGPPPPPPYVGTQGPIGPAHGLGDVAFHQENALSISNMGTQPVVAAVGGPRTRIPAGTTHPIVNRLGAVQNIDIGNLYVTDWGTAEVVANGVTQVQSNMFDPNDPAVVAARLALQPLTPGFTQGLTAHLNTAMVQVAPPGAAPAVGWEGAYAMPWDQRGGAVFMTLPAGVGPDLFFTDLLSGCSVFVVGPPNNPRIYHCGLNPGGYNVPGGTDATDLWKAIVDHTEVTQFGAAPGGAYPSIDMYDYIKDPGGAPGAATAMETAMEAALAAQAGVRAHPPPTATARGVVFGIRDPGTGDWAFYLQTNVVMRWTDTAGVAHSEGRPVSVTRFYPQPRVTHAQTWNF